MAESLWSGVAVAVQSALGSDKTVSAITKDSPGVASSTSHGISDGAYVLLAAQGMYQVDDRVFRVANGATSTFELEGENTTNYDTFVSGTANEITFGLTLAGVRNFSASGGDFNRIDITTIHDLVRKEIPGAANPITYSGTFLWDPTNAGFAGLKAASDVKGKRAIRITFANGVKVVFNGYIGFTGLPAGNAQDVVETPFEITMSGRPTYYTT